MEIYLALLLSLFIIEDSPWTEIEIDPSLSQLQLDPDDWTYPWHVIKHEDYFENTFGEPISEEDTAHLIKNSFCNLITVSNSNESSIRLPFAKANWTNDTLKINIYRFDASSGIDCNLILYNGKFKAQFSNIYSPPIETQLIDYQYKILKLNQIPENGKPIKGKVDITLQENVRWIYSEDDSIDTFNRRIKGTFVIE